MNGASKKMMEAYVKGTNYISTQAEAMKEEASNENSSKAVKAFYAGVAALCGLSVVGGCSGAAFADSTKTANAIGSSFKTIFESVFTAIIAISTAAMVVVVAICLLVRMLSHNPRSAETATEWMKRAIIAWLVINALNLLVQFGRQILKDSGANNTTPWA